MVTSCELVHSQLTLKTFHRRFPKARVWPPAPDAPSIHQGEDEYASQLPDQATQNRLLDIYFRHVHSSFPVIHKESFLRVYRKT